MRRSLLRLALIVSAAAFAGGAASASPDADTALTIYNDNFGVVRETIVLDLKAGENRVNFTDITYSLEPDSVMLRDPSGQRSLRVLEQDYRNDPASQERLLALYEGREIEFLVRRGEEEQVVTGRVVRSGYAPPIVIPGRGQYPNPGGGVPIIEIDGQLRFGLPGQPLFPSLGDDSILKPTLSWTLATDTSGAFNAELAYVTGGLSWKADYNLVVSEDDAHIDVVGWITMTNATGRTFRDARIKLMAGDVNKVQDKARYHDHRARGMVAEAAMAPPVSEKAFDEFHLYTLARATTLREGQTKQVEFLRAGGVTADKVFVYDGAGASARYWPGRWINSPGFGVDADTKVAIYRRFDNTEDNGMGVPLPKGRLRFYVRDDDGQLEFVGENTIDHTPKDETVRVYVGNAFDVVGERVRSEFTVDQRRDTMQEQFEITLRNHKEEAVTVRVVEHLARGDNWKLLHHSHDYTKTESHTIAFPVTVEPDEEVTVTYRVHYWR